MNILIFNQDWFARHFREAGHRVVTCGLMPHLDIVFDLPLQDLSTAVSRAGAGFNPDLILVNDNSAPLLYSGLDTTDVPTIFYSVDTHHHSHIHRYLAHSFDHTYIAQRDYAPAFHELGEHPEWLPLWAPRLIEASQEKRHQAVFIGNMEKALNPERVEFFGRLKERSPLFLGHGDYWNYFPFSEIVVNQTVKGDLNFRVFEALMSGALLLTERSGNGLQDLFADGEHLALYEKNNVEQAAERIAYYLGHRSECRRIAANGREEVLSKHTEQHRAAQVLAAGQALRKRNGRFKHFAMMMNFVSLGKKLAKIDQSLSCRAHIAALGCIETALNAAEELNDELACFLVVSCLRHDSMLGEKRGARLLERAQEAYGNIPLLTIARLREHLNGGRRQEAERLAQVLGATDSQAAFDMAEHVVTSLLSEGA